MAIAEPRQGDPLPQPGEGDADGSSRRTGTPRRYEHEVKRRRALLTTGRLAVPRRSVCHRGGFNRVDLPPAFESPGTSKVDLSKACRTVTATDTDGPVVLVRGAVTSSKFRPVRGRSSSPCAYTPKERAGGVRGRKPTAVGTKPRPVDAGSCRGEIHVRRSQCNS